MIIQASECCFSLWAKIITIPHGFKQFSDWGKFFLCAFCFEVVQECLFFWEYQQTILNTWLYLMVNYSLKILRYKYSIVLILLLIFLKITAGLSLRRCGKAGYETLLGNISRYLLGRAENITYYMQNCIYSERTALNFQESNKYMLRRQTQTFVSDCDMSLCVEKSMEMK